MSALSTKSRGRLPGGNFSEYSRQFREEGVVLIKNLLDAHEVRLAEAAFDYGIAHPGPAAGTAASATINEAAGEKFYTDLSNMPNWSSEEFQSVLRDTPIADVCAALFGSPDVWFFGEQLFWKEGGNIERTTWHQDCSYVCFEGPDTAVVWICLDAQPKESSLEFIPRSHKGATHNGFRLDKDRKLLPFFDTKDMPMLPDIEANRDKYDIVSWPVEPGDVIFFHMGVLHGGAPTFPNRRRRTLSLRFFGPEAKRVFRPPHPHTHGRKSDFDYHFFQKIAALPIGERIANAEGAMRVRPWPAPSAS